MNPEVPGKSLGDYVHAAAEGAIGMVPIAGSPLAKAFAILVSPPLQKRIDAFLADVASRLSTLENQNQLTIDRLVESEELLTAVMKAVEIARRSHHAGKLEALRNAVVTVAIDPKGTDPVCDIFFENIDAFSAAHLAVLAFWHEPPRIGKLGESSTIEQGLAAVVPALGGRTDLALLVCRDLEDRGLIEKVVSVAVRAPTEWLAREPRKKTTTLGDEFLAFIAGDRRPASPEPERRPS